MTDGHQFHVVSRCELLPYLLSLRLGLSRTKAKELLRFGAVKVGRKVLVRHDTRLEAGDLVTIVAKSHAPDEAVASQGLRIVYLDDSIIVVDKPAGLLSIGSLHEKQKTAHRILNEHLRMLARSRSQQAFVVHRLDRETSGLMLFARSEFIQTALQRNWKNVTKRYLAIVAGAFANTQGTLKDHLLETASLKVHRVEKGGALAITHYRVLRRFADKSMLELTLETGRKHQIRVQLAGAGHPIVGDRKYSAPGDLARGLALHSCELKFHHPVTDAVMEFRSTLPQRLKLALPPYAETELAQSVRRTSPGPRNHQ